MYFKKLFALCAILIIIQPAYSAEKDLTLQEAKLLSIKNNPELNIFETEQKINEARMLQAGVRQNPELSGQLENLGGDPAVTGGYQITMQVSQVLEWDEKIESRLKLASVSKNITDARFQVKKNEIEARVSQIFTEVINAQEYLKLTEQMLKIAQELYNSVVARIEAGKINPIEQNRANVTLTSFKIDVDNARQTLSVARSRLAYITGLKPENLGNITSNFYNIPPLLSLDNIIAKISGSPKLALFPLEETQRQAVIDVETIKVKPDLSVNGGYRIFDITKSGNFSFVAGVSVPIPVLNDNQGVINEAKFQLERLQSEKSLLEYNLKSELIAAYTPMLISYNEIKAIKEKLIPQSERVFQDINQIFQAGKYTYLDVLEAQKTLFQIKSRYIRAIADYHKSITEIERIIGKDI